MSPRRRLDPATGDDIVVVPIAKRNWRARLRRVRGLLALSVAAALLIVAAITVTGRMLWSHESDRRVAVKDAVMLGYVRQFMTEFTTLDPFQANDYADRILANATGDFAKQFTEMQNAILIQVARAEPSTGTVLEAGIEKRHDDGSVSVLVATKMTTTIGDPPKPVESGNRWVVTAIKEGQQWKISRLTPVV